MAILTPGVLCASMFAAIAGVLLAGFPVAFSLAGTALLFAVGGAALGLFDLSLLNALPLRIFAIMRNEVLVAVPLFVFMGVMLERSRIAESLLESLGGLFGDLRGGLGYSVFIVGALLAASTGIVGATVIAMGLLSLPTMVRRGYDPALASGTVCAAGTLGQIIPPSIVLVLLGDQLSTAYQQAQYEQGNFAPDTVSVNDLFAGALIPGLILVGLYLAYQFLVTRVRPEAAPALATGPGSSTDHTGPRDGLLGSLLPPIGLMVAVLGSILGGLASPTEAAGVGAVGALLLAGMRVDPSRAMPIRLAVVAFLAMLVLAARYDLRMQRTAVETGEWIAIFTALVCAGILVSGIAVALLNVYRHRDPAGQRILTGVIRQTLTVSSMVFAILIGASLFTLVFRGLGGDRIIEALLTDLPGGAVTVLAVVMVAMFLMGFILDFLEIVFIVVPVVAPVLLTLEIAPGVTIDPIWLGVMMAVNLQTSFLTPPFGLALFYLRGVAPPSIKTTDIYRGVIPFVGLQILMLAILWFVPALATWLPERILGP
jgi:tripartite ATP-independent transporter DctM subunit